ncbi:MAG: HAD-IIB family hydrolase [Candidatus Pacebacteria bacterium]|nr:HAD-IIB family hydrolase [Candidatus Paceibacterota bacterium]
MKKHLFFDLDNTVTRSRSKIAEVMKEALSESGKDIIIVSGATCKQIAWQVDGVSCFKLGQNGNHAEDRSGNLIWEELLTTQEKAEIIEHINSMPRTWEVSQVEDLVQDRGCQISYSLLGHNELLEKKEAFDPKSEIRKSLLEKYPFLSETLQVKIGGTTCFDYTAKGKHKGFYVARLIEKMGWKKEDSVYFGDMLFPGGNDESVIGIIDTESVENPEDTLSILQAKYI